MEKKRKLPARPTGDMVEIKGVQYNVLLRRIPDTSPVRPNRSKRNSDREVSNVTNRRTTQSNAPNENTRQSKKARKEKGISPNHGTTSTRAKK